MPEEPQQGDSLRPIVEQALRSRRLRVLALGWAKAFVAVAVGSGVIPAYGWLSSRYDKQRGEQVERRLSVVERVVGLPTKFGMDRIEHPVSDPEDVSEGKLRDRLLELERVRQEMESTTLRHDHEFYKNFVSVWAASTETRATLRAAAGRAAVVRYEQTAGCYEVQELGCRPASQDPACRPIFRCAVAPALAARPVLMTAVPRGDYP